NCPASANVSASDPLQIQAASLASVGRPNAALCFSRALPNPAIIGPPDPAVTDINPPPPGKTAEEEKVINVAEPPVVEEVEEVVIKVVPIEAMVKVGVMDKFGPLYEVVVQVVRI